MWLEICLAATLLLPPLWSLSNRLSYLHPGACTDHSRPRWLLCSTRPPFRTEGLHPRLLGPQLADGLFGNRPLLQAAALLMAVPLLGHSPHPVTDQWGKVDRPGSGLSWVQPTATPTSEFPVGSAEALLGLQCSPPSPPAQPCFLPSHIGGHPEGAPWETSCTLFSIPESTFWGAPPVTKMFYKISWGFADLPAGFRKHFQCL